MPRPTKIPQAKLDEAKKLRDVMGWSWARIATAVGLPSSSLRHHLVNPTREDDVTKVARDIVNGARNREARKGRKCARNFTIEGLAKMIEKQGFCSLSGVQFNGTPGHPDRPSFDRVPGGDYDLTTGAITTWRCNAMKSTMDREEFLQVCRQIVAWNDQGKDLAMEDAFPDEGDD